jgi:hypothetical protein
MRPAALVALLLGLSTTAGLGGAEAGGTETGPPSSPWTHFMDGPPARVTGGFGEDSCQACHWDYELNDPGGSLRVEGIPEVFVPGESYPITVVLSRGGMGAGGFQLATRFEADTLQAGMLAPDPGDVERLEVASDRNVQFAQHRLGGTRPLRPHATAWTLTWTAPTPREAGPVLFHVSAVAGDGDDSQVGDLVYVFEQRVEPAGG